MALQPARAAQANGEACRDPCNFERRPTERVPADSKEVRESAGTSSWRHFDGLYLPASIAYSIGPSSQKGGGGLV